MKFVAIFIIKPKLKEFLMLSLLQITSEIILKATICLV